MSKGLFVREGTLDVGCAVEVVVSCAVEVVCCEAEVVTGCVVGVVAPIASVICILFPVTHLPEPACCWMLPAEY